MPEWATALRLRPPAAGRHVQFSVEERYIVRVTMPSPGPAKALVSDEPAHTESEINNVMLAFLGKLLLSPSRTR
jgi:hypothetical protein